LEPLARELPEPLARGVVRAERLLVGVLRVGRDLLRDGADLRSERLGMLRVAEKRLDPALRAVVRGHVVCEEELPEQDAAADVRERAEREDAPRRLDELLQLGIAVDDRLDDRADRLVDERNPQLLVLVGHRPGLLLLRPGAPRDLRGRREQEHGEELSYHVLRKGEGDLRARDRGADRGDPDRSRRLRPDVPVALVPPDADDDGRQDREERGRLGVQLREAEPRERRDEQDPAADPEEPGEQAGDEPEEHCEDVRHRNTMSMPMPTSKAAKRSDNVRTGTRCCSAVPAAAPTAAGTPRSAAYAGSTCPWTMYVTTPAVAVIPIAARDVAVAGRSGQRMTSTRSGTITIPPPTPKSALKKPATSPISTKRTDLCYERGSDGRVDRPYDGSARRGGHLSRLRRRPRAHRRASAGCVPAPRDAGRARAARRPLRPRRRRQRQSG